MASFKPEFGNKTHIEVAKLLKDLSDKDRLLEKKMSEVSGIDKLQKEMKSIINNIIFLLEDKTGDK